VRGILRIARKHLASGGCKSLAKLDRDGGLTPKAIFDAAGDGDATAARIVDEVARNTAVGIGALLNLFNPELFIVGGGIAEAGKAYLDAILRHLPDWTLPEPLLHARVVLARLGNRAGAMGASVLVFRDINRFPLERAEPKSIGVAGTDEPYMEKQPGIGERIP
jgi:glucokinase